MRIGALAGLIAFVVTSAALAAPDENVLGKADGYPRAPTLRQTIEDQYIVGSYSSIDAIGAHCDLAPSPTPLPLPRAATETNFSYRFRGQDHTLDDYMQRQRVTAVLVLYDGVIVAERYNYDRTPDMRMLSNSMAKTITELGLLKALEAGLIHSFDDTAAAYVPELAGTLYGETRLLNLMRMASGAKFTEDYTPTDDRSKFNRLARASGYIAAAKSVQERADAEAERFNYAGAQTQVLGLVLRAATRKSVCDYIDETIWQPIGAEAKATWLINKADSVEVVQGGFNATVRDYARLGLMLTNDGVAGGRQIISREHILDMTEVSRQPPSFRPGQMAYHGSTYSGYGLQTWLFPGNSRRFGLYGIHGQSIFVDPGLKIVMVETAVGKDASGDASGAHLGAERDALFRGIVADYGSW
jgi:CubicO group peptidase (beta-lactamase class C family)